LPFFDKALTSATDISKSESPSTQSTVSSSAAPAQNPAQHLLAMAQIYISNGQTDTARAKLQQIIDTYPTDPAAEKAKQLLEQMNH
jgi:TolA-binding protein